MGHAMLHAATAHIYHQNCAEDEPSRREEENEKVDENHRLQSITEINLTTNAFAVILMRSHAADVKIDKCED